jgi:hypothetical protein
MIKLVNGVPKKLVEIDEQVSFVEHMDEDDSSAVISINKFNVDPDEVDPRFLFKFISIRRLLSAVLASKMPSI